ncbi:MAG: restriction endonuclease subunit S [Alistipes sp.]|nr:restriction endonuclease subunit S [Alistipes sp.]
MTEWKTYKIGDLCKISSSKRIFAKEYKDSGIPFYRGKEIIEKQKGNKISTELYISQERYDEIKAKHGVPQKGDMLLTSVGTLGIPYIVQDEVFYFKDGNLTWFYNFEGLDSRYLYYWFLSPIGKMNIDSKAIGSTQKALTIETLSKFEISLPPLEEQRRIAGILGAIDDKIENNRRINTNLELQAQALFDEWLCKVNTIKGTFNDIIDATLAGDWGQETLQGNYTHEVYCIRGADIPAMRNGDKGKMPIRYILERNYLVKQLRANDIVVEISGGSPTQSTGRVCMITKSLLDRLGKDVVCTNFCRAITPKNGYAIFIFLYWQMLYNKNTMFGYENGTTGIKNLNIADLISKEPINVPKQEDVDKLNVVLQPIYDQIYANGLQNETLATLRDTLLPKLMNGEIKL